MYSSSSASSMPAPNTIFGRAKFPVLCFSWRGVEKVFIFDSVLITVAGGIVAFLTLAFIFAGGYLFLRDDLVRATLANQARMKHAYEDRLTALRAQVDVVTSRQLLDQQAVEQRVTELIARQEKLSVRSQQAKSVLSRVTTTGSIRTASSKKPAVIKKQGLRLGSLSALESNFQSGSSSSEIANADSEFFNDLEQSLQNSEQAQLEELNQLKTEADKKTHKLAQILKKQGVRVPKNAGVGGPLIALKGSDKFSDSVEALDASLKALKVIRKAATSLPHGSPVAGMPISSKFGSRRDPFTGKRAVHGGLDFRAGRGHVVRSTAAGTVVKAGRVGGYGKLIEIDHGGGITTRYGHLSKIKVRVGERIARGRTIGNVGSTGRSTGPHLHYEVRRKGRVLNPIHFVRLEKRIKPYL